MLGLYVSDHPLFGLEHVLTDKADAGIAQLTGGEHADGAVVTIGGIISGLQRKMTKQGNAWAIATVEDLAGSIECMFFPATYQLISTQLVEDTIVFVKGRLDKREDVPRLVAMEMQVPDVSNVGTNAPRDPHHPGDQGHPADGEQARRDPQPPPRRQRGPHRGSRARPRPPCCAWTGTG
ncbi:OB-fold nucleic acid binding domain-containing protein [Streptomyces sp. L7]